MPTNEQRRNAAKLIRQSGDGYPSAWQRMRDIIGMPKDFTLPQVRDGLADLIEPEPERACTGSISKTTCEWICERCGGSIQGAVFKPGIDAFTDVPNYCPNCGAKVVD